MSSLPISIVYFIVTIVLVENKKIYFTQSTYDLWCQENRLSHSLFLYPDRIPIGISRTSNIQSVVYHLVDDHHNNGLFYAKTQRIGDFYFSILHITRPLDINREYQDVYVLRLQANIMTKQGNHTEQAKIYLHVADSNDNDAVFDMDIYEKTFIEPLETSQSLIRFHASDADEIQHAQIFYELSFPSLNNPFSLHPFTGELYFVSNENQQSIYEFDIYAYDRHRKYLMNNNIKTKAHVRLIVPETKKMFHRVTTILNETIVFTQMISSYKISFSQRSSWNLLNIHQPILSIEVSPPVSSFDIFILENSSLNSIDLFIYQNKIYLNTSSPQQYNLHLLFCFHHRTQCQHTNYHLTPPMTINSSHLHFPSIQPISIDEDLPIHSYITRLQLHYIDIIPDEQFHVTYKLLNNDYQFNLHRKTGVLRLDKPLKYEEYSLDIQADVHLFTEYSSIRTTIKLNIREVNKYQPRFIHDTLTDLFQLPYQFQASDFDRNKETNGRVSYRLWNCSHNCPFELNFNDGLLQLSSEDDDGLSEAEIYYLQIIAFDWGEPRSLESRIDVRIDLSTRLIKRDLGRRWNNQSMSSVLTIPNTSTYSLPQTETVYLNIGFKEHSASYHLSEDAEIHTIIDYIHIDYDSFPFFIDKDKENLFYYIINDTSVPFTIDSNEATMQLITSLDREKQDQYTFEVELRLKSTYQMKLQEIYISAKKNISYHFQYSSKYYQKMLFTIYIEDVNDNIPMCHSFHQHIYLYENQLQTNIFHVQAFDLDLGENGTIIYSLLDYNQYFTINSSTGQIDSIQSIDREQIPFVRLHIITSDQGQQVQLQSICMTLHITIVDINDNTPQFSLPYYLYEIFSDLPRQTIIGQIHASDVDLSDVLMYSIDFNPYIKINQDTGHLHLQSDLHHLVEQYLNITVKVSDGLHVNQTWLYIHVKGFIEAQEPILVSEPAYSIIINQSSPIGTVVTNVYERLQLSKTSIDFIEIIREDLITPFTIDQQGSIRLMRALTDASNASYWLSIRLTRYRARPPHSFIRIHLSIREENFYLPQCVDNYQQIKVYDYSIQYPFATVQALSSYNNIHLHYEIITDNWYENIFSIDKQTGSMQLLPSTPNNPRSKSDYLLTIRALDSQHQLSVDCYLKVHLIQRRRLTPKFLQSSIYDIDLLDTSSNNERLRQRLFQVIAVLDHRVYDKNLEVRYRITDTNGDFIINRQTGYIASKQLLHLQTTYEFTVEAFTVAHYDDIEVDENDHDEHSDRRQWRIVSSRVALPIRIRIRPRSLSTPALVSMNQSTINILLPRSTKVGSILSQLGINDTHTQWFIMVSPVDHTRYFHINFQSGELILIRPLDELVNRTRIIQLYINVTRNWIDMYTIKVIVHIIDDNSSPIRFSQTDYYSSVSKNLPIGIEIARLTIENLAENCTYDIHSVERIKSKDFFRIDPSSGSITIIQSLEESISEKHLLTIVYHCRFISLLAFTRLHVNILDKDKLRHEANDLYRFRHDNYLVVFETSLLSKEKKYLLDLELISDRNLGKTKKPDAQIIDGDPLGLFTIDSLNQSLILLDESRSRSYIYPIQLTIMDTSQQEFITCTVRIFISNIGMQFTCPSSINPSPYLFTYESTPKHSIDRFTGQQYARYNSLTTYGFDPHTPSTIAQCVIHSPIVVPNETIDFIFEKEMYHGYINQSLFVYNNNEPLRVSIKNRNSYSNPFDITYQLINQSDQHPFQLDPLTGLIRYIPRKNPSKQYSFLLLAKYQSLLAFTRLNIFIHTPKPSIYKFKVFKPFVHNYTVGYLKEIDSNVKIIDRKIAAMFSIDIHKRLFVQNETLVLIEGSAFDFIIGTTRVQIIILSKPMLQCSLKRFHSSAETDLIGFIDTLNSHQKRSFYLLNYNYLFLLDQEYGLLRYRNWNQWITNDLVLLIEVDHARCLIQLNRSSLRSSVVMGRDSILEMKRYGNTRKLQHNIRLHHGVLLHEPIASNQAPIFSQNTYTFLLDLTHTIIRTIFIGQVSAEPYDLHRSHLVYHFLSPTKHFSINPDSGVIEYISNGFCNKTIQRFQIIARDLIYQQTATTNITIHIQQPEFKSLQSLIYHQTLPETLPPGSIVFQSNVSTTQTLQYSLLNHDSNLFEINSNTGQVTLLNYLVEPFYSFQIHIAPIKQIFIVKLTILNSNNHPPIFSNLPSNLTISSEDVFVTKLSAHDLDVSDHQKLKYYLLDHNQQQTFSINEQTGLITLKTPINQTSIQLKIAVSDGLHVTSECLPLTIDDYSKHALRFSSDEYSFLHNDIVGQISAYDSDPNDRLIYQLYLEPDGIQIDQYSGLITSNRTLFSQTIEFVASASDRARQIVYTKIKILFPIQPRFTSYLYFISLITPIQVPSEIFHFQLVDSFNQLLSSARFEIDQSTNLFQINQNKLILKEYPHPSRTYHFDINGYWKNFTCQTSIQIKSVDQNVKLTKKIYEFQIELTLLKEDYLIEKFQRENSSLKILSTPLTMNNCTDNFYLKDDKLYFHKYPILAHLCFLELQVTNGQSISASPLKIFFVQSDLKPQFSSKSYYFYSRTIQVFAKSSNTIRYQLPANSYGLIINSTTGIVSFKYVHLDHIQTLDRIQLLVYAIDEKTSFNDTAWIQIIFNRRKQFEVPTEIPSCSNTSLSISDQSLPGTVIDDVYLTNNNTNDYYILAGDTYGLFSINALGQLHLVSSMLNRTFDKYFQLTILLSPHMLSYCRANISIIRTPKWSYFICPAMPIEWTIVEESPIGTTIGNIKDVLLMINNNSQLLDLINMTLNSSIDSRAFLLNSTTGLLTVNSRLDYEQKTMYEFSVVLEPAKLHCSLSLLIKLININDNLISFDQQSLTCTIDRNRRIPSYIGRLQLIDLDRLSFFEYKYYLQNSSAPILIDAITGAIVLLTKLDRNTHGEKLQYPIIAIHDFHQKNFTDILVIHISYKSLFDKNAYHVIINKSIRPGNIVFQITASSNDRMNNENVSYSLIDGPSSFTMEKYTGVIHLNDFLPSTITNWTLIIEVLEAGRNLTDRTNVFISVEDDDDDDSYFQMENKDQCFLDENQAIGTLICTMGKASSDFSYYLIDPMNVFDLLPDDGIVINRKIFDYERDQHEYHVMIVVHDRNNQSAFLSSLNLTIYIRNLNDNPPEFLGENLTTLFYLFSPSVNASLYRIEAIDKDQSNLTYEILNDTLSTYLLCTSFNTTELLILKRVIHNREDNLIIRVWDDKIFFSDLHLRIIYFLNPIEYPTILSQTIDGYVNLQDKSSVIKLGQLFIQNHSQYHSIYFHLETNKHFFLKHLSNNQMELYVQSIRQSSFVSFQINLTVIALHKPIPEIIYHNKTKVFLPSTIRSQIMNIHLWPIGHEMLNRTIPLIMNINPNSTYEHFILRDLPFIRENVAQSTGVPTHNVHIYSFDFQHHQIELLIAVLRPASFRYVHKKFLYNLLKNSTNLLGAILLNRCQFNPCEHNGHCTSHISLLYNQYEYLYFDSYQRLVPKYERKIKCLCANNYYGEYCQFKQDKQSPCSSNPCLPMESCIETSSTLYRCQCMDDLCNYDDIITENSLECININSPICRDPSNTLTFDGFSFIRMNLTISPIRHTNITFSFRTESTQGELLKITYLNDKSHSIAIQIIDGYIHIALNEKILLQLPQIPIHDGQWHDIYFSIDYSPKNYYYLLRLDHVFGDKISLSQDRQLNDATQIIIGSDFHGCLGNLTFNKRAIVLHQAKQNHSIEFHAIKNGCRSAAIVPEYSDHDDLCSLYHPCYHGGLCTNHGSSFMCNCSNARFTGRQCQFDLRPCESYPCKFDEQCILLASDSDKSYTCMATLVSLSITIKRAIYIGLVIVIILFVALLSMIYYRKKRKGNFNLNNPSVSSPLLIRKSSLMINETESPMQSSVKLKYDRRQTKKTMTLVDGVRTNSTMNNFNNRSTYLSYESLNYGHNNDSKYYSSIEQMNILPTNLPNHYTSVHYDAENIPQPTDLFDFSPSPTQYFNIHNSDSQINYRLRMNTLSDLTADFIEHNDIDLTGSSNVSSNNDQILLKPLIPTRDQKRSFLFNYHNIPTSTISLAETPIYARIVKTPKMLLNGMNALERLRLSHPLTSAPTLFIKPIENVNDDRSKLTLKTTTRDHIKHASDPDLYNENESSHLSSCFQTDV